MRVQIRVNRAHPPVVGGAHLREIPRLERVQAKDLYSVLSLHTYDSTTNLRNPTVSNRQIFPDEDDPVPGGARTK